MSENSNSDKIIKPDDSSSEELSGNVQSNSSVFQKSIELQSKNVVAQSSGSNHNISDESSKLLLSHPPNQTVDVNNLLDNNGVKPTTAVVYEPNKLSPEPSDKSYSFVTEPSMYIPDSPESGKPECKENGSPNKHDLLLPPDIEVDPNTFLDKGSDLQTDREALKIDTQQTGSSADSSLTNPVPSNTDKRYD